MLPWREGTIQEHTGTDFTSHSIDPTVFVINFYHHVVDMFVLNLCYFHVRDMPAFIVVGTSALWFTWLLF